MSTRVSSGGPSPQVAPSNSASRVTPPPARPFKQFMGAGAQAVVDGAESALRRLPGGPVVSAALRPGGGGFVAPAGSRPEGSPGTAGTDGGTPRPGVEEVMAQNSDMNLYYLELQERISAESRSYTALSNVLKARHDTVKNAIGNIR
ncbi:MAG: hypothetical protein KF718_20600 [Polyangiaceae bacterium]|nr:hypothetical protein [Polyangiaceae bacterium]